MIIGSLLTMANNALLYSGRTLLPPQNVTEDSSSDNLLIQAEESEDVLSYPVEIETESYNTTSTSSRFVESLKSRLKETGLSGEKNAAELDRITQAAENLVNKVDSTQGSLEANRLKATILLNAQGDASDGALTIAVASYTVQKLQETQENKSDKKDDREVTKDEIAHKVADKAAEEVEKEASIASETSINNASNLQGTDKVDIPGTIRATLQELQSEGLDASIFTEDLIPIINKVQGQIQNNFKVQDSYSKSYYRAPDLGSLFSVRV